MSESTLKVAGLYQNLAQIAQFVTNWATKAQLDHRAAYALEMAVDEACSNIIQHAYGGEGKGDITLHCQQLSDGLKVTIIDYGKPFNPSTVKTPDVAAPIEERDEGGLGLFLIKQLMDEVTFDFDDKQNTLVIIKKNT